MITWGPWPGDQSGGSGPTSSFLSDIFDAGEASSPSVHNLMTGPLQRAFFNLGTTPPPFPPNAQPFFPECALFLGESPADSGVGADSKPLLRTQRHFSTFPSLGDHWYVETQYDLFGSGVNSITGGDRILHTLIDQFDNRLTFALESQQLTRPGLNAPGYTPIYLDNAPVTYQTWAAMDALGGGNTNDWTWNSDGANFRRVFIPNVIGPGGGPAGPWNFVADAMAMWARNAGEPLVGSRLYYDAVTVQTFGNVSDDLGQFIVGQAAVLDAKNLGSGQAAGHAETWIKSTLGGPLVLATSWYDDLVDIPVEIIGHAGAVFIGGLTSDGTTATTGDVNVGADLHVGAGDATVAGTLDVGGQMTSNTGIVPVVYETATVNLMATGTYSVSMPLVAGKRFYLRAPVRIDMLTRDAALTTGLTYDLAQNGVSFNTAAITNTTINTLAAPATYPSSTGIIAPDLTTFPIDFKITTPVAGAGLTTCTGRLVLIGTYE